VASAVAATGAVAGGLVQPHRQPAPARPDEIDLHDDGGGPGQPLADAEQHIRGDDPTPTKGPDEQQRHGERDQPAGDQDGFAAVPVRPGACQVVGDGLRDAEGEDESERRCVGGEVKRAIGQQREHGAFLAEHPADKSVHRDQKAELSRVLPQPQPQVLVVAWHCVGGRV
jgi:hypothetical protein